MAVIMELPSLSATHSSAAVYAQTVTTPARYGPATGTLRSGRPRSTIQGVVRLLQPHALLARSYIARSPLYRESQSVKCDCCAHGFKNLERNGMLTALPIIESPCRQNVEFPLSHIHRIERRLVAVCKEREYLKVGLTLRLRTEDFR